MTSSVGEGATAPSPRFERPVVCKCGEQIWSVAEGKVHFLIMSIMPWKHVRKSA